MAESPLKQRYNKLALGLIFFDFINFGLFTCGTLFYGA